jgi:hypothetical protein
MEMMQEKWKEILGYEGVYQVSSFGRIKRLSTGKILRPNLSGSYPSVTLCMNKVKKDFSVHTLVCRAFNGTKPTPDHEVNHIDGIKTNNRHFNLEWVTKSEQQRHRYKILGHNGPMTGKSHSVETRAKIARWTTANSSRMNELKRLKRGAHELRNQSQGDQG